MKQIHYYILFLFCWLSAVAYGQGGPMIVDLGVLPAGNFDYQHTADTRQTTNIYRPDLWLWPESPNDVCYRFVVETPTVIIAHATMMSTLCNVYIEGYAFGVQDPVMPFQKFENTGHIAAMLPKGLYHIISEGTLNNGVISNGNITTFISATPAVRMQYNFGDFTTHFSKEICGDTQRASNAYGNPSRNDIYYYFNLKRPMDVSVSLNSGIDVNLYLLNRSGNELVSSQNGLLEAEQLPAGFYFLVVEGKNNDDYFSVDFELTPEESAIDLGKVSGSKTFSETFNTANSENRFGLPANEIFYKLQLTRGMGISISARSSILSDHYMFATAVYLLDAEENIIQSSQNGIKGFTIENLDPGTYYIVSEGKTQDLNIITEISIIGFHANVSNHNNIITHTYTEADGSGSRISIDYFDGLRRPTETVLVGASPLGKDIVTRQDYDKLGRLTHEWLPRISEHSNGKYLTSAEFEGLSSEIYDNDTHPYSMPVYENSPLNRVLEQYGPGTDWHDNNKSVETAYKINISGSATLKCKLYQVGGNRLNPTLSQNGNYADGELYVTELKDEDGNTSYEFKDKLERVVLTRQIVGNESYDTYYIYDDFGNKCFVLPPRIDDEGIAQTKLDELAFQYRYDGRNRCIGKKIPGCDWTYYIYDESDRSVFSQDGEQRTKGEWMFSISDAFNRIVLTGICKNTFNYMTDPLKATVVKATWMGGTNVTKGYAVSGVTLMNPVILSANYYDNYSFMGINNIPDTTNLSVKYEQEAESEGFGKRYTTSAKGLLTGTLIAQLADQSSTSLAHLYSVMYYDERKRVIQIKTNNHLTEGINKEYIAYDFIGQVTQRKRIHQATGKPTQTELYAYTYDYAGRLLTTTHKLNDGEATMLTDNEYDELGRLKTNKRNGNTNLKTDYTYNVRSWMKTVTGPLFSQTLYYNDRRTATPSNIPSYNGNISAMDWKVTASGDNKQRGYDFSYDALSRLTATNYLENNAASTKFSTSYTYDKHGNMLSLLRSGNQGTTTYGPIDNLTLAYSGNQLIKVEDTAANPTLSMSMDFKNGANQATEYIYDANGNQKQDLNKGITNIEYNSLNLPRRINFSGTGSPSNEYIYSATGAKLAVIHRSSTDKRTDYVGNLIYENGSLTRILVRGGYIENGVYYFYIQDHLKNNRVVAKQDGTVIQANHYYPFGSSFAEGGADRHKQPYQYNGKELDTQNELNWYDYDARQMDVALGRFTRIDPMAEKYLRWSPYVYCLGNPVKYIDPNGEKVWIYNQDNTDKLLYTANMPYKGNDKFVSEAVNTLNIIYNNGGNNVLDVLIESKNHFNLKNILPTDEKGNPIKAFAFKGFFEGGGDIYAGLLLDPEISKFNKIKGLSHELFHAFQHEKRQGGTSIYNELEARVFANNVASNWAFHSTESLSFSFEDWINVNTTEGMGNETFAGYLYQEAFSRLRYGYSAIAFGIAVASFKEGSISNAAGLYNTYPLRRTNQVVSLLNQYFVKQRQ